MTRDQQWITDHFEELVEKYGGKYIAVCNEMITAVGESSAEVDSLSRKKSGESTIIPSVMHVPHRESEDKDQKFWKRRWRMKKLIVILLGIFIQSCVMSINPWYSKKDIIYDKRLDGKWMGIKEKDVKIDFKKIEDENKYLITFVQGNDSGVFKGTLTKIGSEYYMDFIPYDNKAFLENRFEAFYFIPGHFIIKIKINDTELLLIWWELEWIVNYLDKNKRELKYYYAENNIGSLVITDTTKSLRTFIFRHTKELFKDDGVRLKKTD